MRRTGQSLFFAGVSDLSVLKNFAMAEPIFWYHFFLGASLVGCAAASTGCTGAADCESFGVTAGVTTLGYGSGMAADVEVSAAGCFSVGVGALESKTMGASIL